MEETTLRIVANPYSVPEPLIVQKMHEGLLKEGKFKDFRFPLFCDTERLQNGHDIPDLYYQVDACNPCRYLEEFAELSRNFLDVLFKLEIRSDKEDFDMYFRNGKSQICRRIVTYEPFDGSKMK